MAFLRMKFRESGPSDDVAEIDMPLADSRKPLWLIQTLSLFFGVL